MKSTTRDLLNGAIALNRRYPRGTAIRGLIARAMLIRRGDWRWRALELI